MFFHNNGICSLNSMTARNRISAFKKEFYNVVIWNF